jgi:hypothetical protein
MQYHRTHVRPRDGFVAGECAPVRMPRVRRSIDRPRPKSRRLAFLSHVPLRVENLEHRWTELCGGNPRANPFSRDEWSAAGARHLIAFAVRLFDCQCADGDELRLDVQCVVLLKLGGSGVLAGL